MVSIMIISHSSKIAYGTKELAEQMMQAPIEIKAVGGTADGDLGTDVDKIKKTMKKINKESGVIVLVDLGSAVMSYNMVYDWLDENNKSKFRLANAPLVEGTIFATIEASLGKSINEIIETIEQKNIILKN